MPRKTTPTKSPIIFIFIIAMCIIVLLLSVLVSQTQFSMKQYAQTNDCAIEKANYQRALKQLDSADKDTPEYNRAQTNLRQRSSALVTCQTKGLAGNTSQNSSGNNSSSQNQNLNDTISIGFMNSTGQAVKLKHLYAVKGINNNIGDFTGDAHLADNETFYLTQDKICNDITNTYIGHDPAPDEKAYIIKAQYAIINSDGSETMLPEIQDSFNVKKADGRYYCDTANLILRGVRSTQNQGSITIFNRTSPPRLIQLISVVAESSPFPLFNTRTELLDGVDSPKIDPYKSTDVKINNCQDHGSSIKVTVSYQVLFPEGAIVDEVPVVANFDCRGQNSITITHSDKKGALEKTPATCEDGKTVTVEGCGPDGSGVQRCTERLTRTTPHYCINVNCSRCEF